MVSPGCEPRASSSTANSLLSSALRTAAAWPAGRALPAQLISRCFLSGINRTLTLNGEAMAKIVKLAQQIAASEASVQITGESGTGKEVLARFVHGRSACAKKPFISGELRGNSRKPA